MARTASVSETPALLFSGGRKRGSGGCAGEEKTFLSQRLPLSSLPKKETFLHSPPLLAHSDSGGTGKGEKDGLTFSNSAPPSRLNLLPPAELRSGPRSQDPLLSTNSLTPHPNMEDPLPAQAHLEKEERSIRRSPSENESQVASLLSQMLAELEWIESPLPLFPSLWMGVL